MLRRSIYLKGQKALIHWEKVSKFWYQVISTTLGRHTHSCDNSLCREWKWQKGAKWNHAPNSAFYSHFLRGREKLLCCFQNSKKRLLGKKVCTSVFSQWHFKALTGGGMNGVRASPRAYGVIHGLVWLPDPSPTATTFSASTSGGAHCWALQLIKLTMKLEVLLLLTGNASFNNSMAEENMIFAVSCSTLML